jgi:outer membrane receptor protein involved in Fe transport
MEKQDAFEVGYTGTIGSNAAVFVTAYDQRVTNKIWFLPVSFYGPGAPPPGWPSADPATVPFLPHVFSFINLGSVRNRGVELAATYSVARLSLQGNYTFKADPEQGGSSLIPLTLNRPARHQFGGSLIASAARWTGSASAHYTDSAFWADVLTEPFWGETPSFVDVNGGIAYRIPKRPWEFRLDATNLFDQKIKSHAYGDIVRRKVTAGVRWRWDKRLPPQASRRTASPAASRGTIAPRHD